MERAHPNWVERYAKCNMQALYRDLTTHIIQDVRDRDCIAHNQKEDVRFTHKDTDTLNIFRTQQGQQTIEWKIVLERDTVRVHMLDHAKVCDITTRWDADAIQCRVVLTGAAATPIEYPHDELWKIVHVILRPFFFPA